MQTIYKLFIVAGLLVQAVPAKADCIRDVARWVDGMNDKREIYQEKGCNGPKSYLKDLEKTLAMVKGCKNADPEGSTAKKTAKSVSDVQRILKEAGCE